MPKSPDDDLANAVAQVRAMPDGPHRSAHAATLAIALLTGPYALGDTASVREIGAMLEIADRFPPADPRWPRMRASASLVVLMGAAVEGRMSDPGEAILRLNELEGDIGDEPAARMLVESARTMFTYVRSTAEGDQSAYTRMPIDVERMLAVAGDHPAASALAEYAAEATKFYETARSGGDYTSSLDALHDKAERLFGADTPVLEHLDNVVQSLRTLGTPGGEASMAEDYPKLAEAARRPGLSDAERALRHSVAGGAALAGGTERDPERIAASIGHFREAVALSGPHDPRYAFLLSSLGMGLYRKVELTGDAADIAEAADVLEQARAAAGGPDSPVWPLINDMLTHIRGRRGEPDARENALDALRGVAWNVLLQGDPAAARRAARDAASSAVDTARLCLLAGDPADAIRALEGGRGLLLFAAGEFREVVSRLVAAGRPELAERWRRVVEAGEVDRVPTNLRSDVLKVLAEHSGVLDPPSLAEIQHALRLLDADALIYLVPGGDGHPGYAVAAPAAGPPGYVGLANLSDDQDRDVERWLSTLATRDLSGEKRPSVTEELDKLCDWAWRAAVGPIIEKYLPTLTTTASGRVPRVILVPMGRLALVPWQAARRGDGVYAVELAAVSLAVSARLLCRAAASAPVPAVPVGLVVGDPDTGRPQDRLPAARIEAYAIHQAFYRGGRYLGTRADGTASRAGAGTSAELLDWLDAARPGAGAVLHLACHGVIEGDDADLSAYLLLAGGDRVTAEQIVRALSTGPDRGIGLAVLAACRTGHSIHGYDEAYSLGTAFLAGGVRSVLATQWAVPDQSTSVLMYMFHHFLTTRRLPAWAALREAQLWMLSPDHPVPVGMPNRLLQQLAGIGTVGLEAWAGFVHQGQ